MTITKDKSDETIETFYLTKVISVRPDGDSKESKQVTLKVRYEGVTIRQMANATLGQGIVVKWQNGGSGRKNFDNIKAHSVIDVDFKAPGVGPGNDPESAMIGMLMGMNEVDRMAYLMELAEKAKK